MVNRIEEAFPAIEEAIGLHRAAGDREGVGRCTRILSRLTGTPATASGAWAKALEAIAILEPLGRRPSSPAPTAGSRSSRCWPRTPGQALVWGERALELATRLGDERTRAHALVNLGRRAQLDRPARPRAAARGARGRACRGRREEAARALGNLGYVLHDLGAARGGRRYTEQALAYAREHEMHSLGATSS